MNSIMSGMNYLGPFLPPLPTPRRKFLRSPIGHRDTRAVAVENRKRIQHLVDSARRGEAGVELGLLVQQ